MSEKRSREELDASGSVNLINEPTSAKKRRSRFDEDASQSTPVLPSSHTAPDSVNSSANAFNTQLQAERLAKAAEIQRQLASQLASLPTLLTQLKGNGGGRERKVEYHALRLDAQGREVDEHGNLVKQNTQVKTLAANVTEKKKKENPYLQHASDATEETIAVDDRLALKSARDMKSKKALKFIEAGAYVQMEDKLRLKEERKIIAGYASGRKAPELIDESGNVEEGTTGVISVLEAILPPPVDGGVVPSMEWWDEIFLPKATRELRKTSRAAAEENHHSNLNIGYCKAHKLVQHPLPVKPLGGTVADVPLPMYLTKQERKRLRKQTRALREQEKRDKMLLGLLPTPEPKFKLSNFMKLLGDQAVADPSKVERRVIEQMQKRQLNHEMRNLSAKLTPAERKAKRTRKNQEDTSRQVSVAVYRVRDLSNPKHRFKVDVNAQQFFMSGTVILCPEGDCNLVVVEGGPRGVRKFNHLMLERIHWLDRAPPLPVSVAEGEEGEEGGEAAVTSIPVESQLENKVTGESPPEESGDSDSDSDDSDDGDEERGQFKAGDRSASSGHAREGGSDDNYSNYCMLVWQGVTPKRMFTGFRFQECRSQLAARKLLEGKSAAHYLDMAMQLDTSTMG